MVDHLRLVRPEFLEEILRERFGRRQPEPIALQDDRAAGALHRLDERQGAHGSHLWSLRWRQPIHLAVPLVSFAGMLVSSERDTAPNSPAISMWRSVWSVWSVLES
jgi:hypothetical protein